MTDKRFKADNSAYEIWDNDEFLLSFDQTVDLLNELNDTNEYLRQSLKRQQSSNKECSKYIEEVQKENEELKQQVAFLEEFLKSGVQYEYYQKVYDENKQLKQEIETLQELIAHFDIEDV